MSSISVMIRTNKANGKMLQYNVLQLAYLTKQNAYNNVFENLSKQNLESDFGAWKCHKMYVYQSDSKPIKDL